VSVDVSVDVSVNGDVSAGSRTVSRVGVSSFDHVADHDHDHDHDNVVTCSANLSHAPTPRSTPRSDGSPSTCGSTPDPRARVS
jgi:ABC-type nickel/cobalt efflux system permease component RcnA